jgi:putative ABC transport system permease protein
MLKSYFRLAWRSLTLKKGLSFINISGLAVGMAAAVLIFSWVQNEYSYDAFHANKKTLYKIWNRTTAPGYISCWDVTSAPVAGALKKNFPEIKSAARVYWSIDRLFSFGDRSLKAKGNDVDKDFLTMFTFPLTEGDAAHALDHPNGLVITRQLATRLFGTADPINRVVKINDKEVYTVTGVMKDLPNNTQFDFEYLVSLAADENQYSDNSWGNNTYNTYVQLQLDADPARVDAKIASLVARNDPQQNVAIFLHPLSKWRLYSNFENGKIAGGRIDIVRWLLVIAGIILLIACINFMNLSTAQSQKKAREVGVRKVIGATRGGLIAGFLTESVLIAFLSGLLALLLAGLCLPAFNRLTDKHLTLEYGNPIFWIIFFGFILTTGLLAGSYPAIFLSRYRPVKVLKGFFSYSTSWLNPRKVLVVMQFTVAIVFIIATVIVYRQIRFAQQRDAGYSTDHLIEVPVEGDINKNFDLIKTDLVNGGAAMAMCKTSYGVTVEGSTGGGLTWEGGNASKQDQQSQIFVRFASAGDFVRTMNLRLVAGRDIDLKTYKTDSAALLLNETAVRLMGLSDPIGKSVTVGGNRVYHIVGVFKDFIINSPYSNTDPMVVYAAVHWVYNTVIRLNLRNNDARNLEMAASIFRKYNPAYPFTYHFVDQEYQAKFDDQQETGTIAAIFTGLTIFISCLGLFALSAFMAENRLREIGIRKVLGASVTGIVRLLSMDIVGLVAIAILIAIPVAWFLAHKWLQDFTYRIEPGWLTFVIAGLSAIFIALATVSFHAIRAALINPARTIRTE